MNLCYILFSPKLDRFYIGATHDGIEERLKKHNAHSHGNEHYTATAVDWEIFLVIECTDYPQAIRIERHIKKMKSTTYIKNLKKYPEMIQKLYQK